MLGKIPAAGRGFKGVVSYLLRGPAGKERRGGKSGERQDAKPAARRNRVLFVATENLLTNDPEMAARIMRATANRSARCKAPVYHFVISWREEDRPDFATMRAIVDEACAELGLDDLQRIAIGHDDTRHRHVHVVVNRIHPDTGKAWNRRQDWVRLEVSLARIAGRYGYDRVPGRHNEPARFKETDKKAPDREYQMACRQGAASPPMKWGHNRVTAERPRLAAAFDAARSWEDLHTRLAALGYRLESKGAGLVIRDGTSELKLSMVSKTARIKTLEQRFGKPFHPTSELPIAAPRLAPERGNADTAAVLPQDKATPAIPEAVPAVDYSEITRKHSGIGPAAPPSADDDDDDNQPRRRRRSR
jgi:hypothetical protein